MTKLKQILCTAAVALLISSSAWAARTGTIVVSKADIVDAANPGARVIARVRQGTRVAVGNKEYGGYLKIRTPAGRIGYVTTDSVQMEDTTQPPVGVAQVTPEERAQENTRSSNKHKMELSGFGGLNFSNMTAVSDQANTDEIKTAAYFGLEGQAPISPSISLALRGEYLTKKATATVTGTTNQYVFSFKTMPVLLGLVYRAVDSDSTSLQLGAYGGVGLGTSFTSAFAGNDLKYSKSAFGGLLRGALTFKLSKSLGFFAETGYRLMKASNVEAATDSAGNPIFQNAAGNYVAMSIDFSGLILGAGLTLVF